MKKAVVVGGSNGIGLSVSKKLTDLDYHVIIVDRVIPDKNVLDERLYEYVYMNLIDLQEDLLCSLASDEDISVLMITAGIGRIADFQYFHTIEIENTFFVNTVSIVKIVSIFYKRICNKEDFYTGIMCSIAGHIISPAASLYASSKAALVRFIESVNVELYGMTTNRILDVSPGSFKGSRFYGDENNIDLLKELTNGILSHLFNHDVLYIPQYEEIYKDIITRYQNDPQGYGLYSYEYKKKSGRLKNDSHIIVGYLSGTFDLFHVGHLNLLQKAKEHCDYLIVGVHDSGAWKGKDTYISLDDRKRIVASCRYVNKVVDSCREDSDAWYLWHYDRLFVGSDYMGSERFQKYESFFKDKNVEIVYFPYTKGISSTQLRNNISNKAE